MGGRSLAFDLLGSILGSCLRREQQSLVSGVEEINMELKDSTVHPSLPVVLGWIPGARSLVSGVVGNAPGFFTN